MKKSLIIIMLTLALALCSACGDTHQELTDETITSLIDTDLSISHFLYTEPPNSDYYDTTDYNGRTYYRIIDEKYDTWSEWESYILSAYCGDLAEFALSSDTIINIDGNSYCDGGSRGYDLSDNYTYEITSLSDDAATVLVRNPTIDNDYVRETTYTLKLTDGGWRIEIN